MGEVGSRILFENDRVRVWEIRLDPGEESAVHEHTLDYLMVQIDGDRMAGVSEPDSTYVEGDIQPGTVLYAERGGIERARNVGARPYHEVIIELKD